MKLVQTVVAETPAEAEWLMSIAGDIGMSWVPAGRLGIPYVFTPISSTTAPQVIELYEQLEQLNKP